MCLASYVGWPWFRKYEFSKILAAATYKRPPRTLEYQDVQRLWWGWGKKKGRSILRSKMRVSCGAWQYRPHKACEGETMLPCNSKGGVSDVRASGGRRLVPMGILMLLVTPRSRGIAFTKRLTSCTKITTGTWRTSSLSLASVQAVESAKRYTRWKLARVSFITKLSIQRKIFNRKKPA